MSEHQEKKKFLLRMDESMFRDLSEWADEEFRSLNGQIEYLLHRAIQERKKGKDK